MTPRMNFSHGPMLVMVAAALLTVAGCKHGTEQQHPRPQPPKSAEAQGALRPAPTERVSELEEDMQVQPPRTTSDARLPLPWDQVTPTVAADAAPTAPKRVWNAPAVLIGRKQVWLREKAIAPVHCVSKQPQDCTPEALQQPSAIATFGFLAEELADGKLTALTAAAAELKDKDVPVIADRRVNWQAVDAVMTTLRAAGARPVFAAGSHNGELVNALGAGTALPEAPTLIAARKAAEPGESVPGSLPSDATSVTVLVTANGVSVEIARATGEPAYPEVLGNLVESLIALCERLRLALPQITSITIRADGAATVEQVVQAIDGVRDTCGKTARGQQCTGRTQLFATISLESAGATPEAVKVGLDAPLHLDSAAPTGLHLSDSPDPLGKPATPGLHLSP